MTVSKTPFLSETLKVDPTLEPFQINNSVTESILVNVEFEEKLLAEALTQIKDVSNKTTRQLDKSHKTIENQDTSKKTIEKPFQDDETKEDCRNATNLNLLQSVFPNCRRYLSHTECQGSSDLSKFGFCLVKSYPETRVLSLSQTLTSGNEEKENQSVTFII